MSETPEKFALTIPNEEALVLSLGKSILNLDKIPSSSLEVSPRQGVNNCENDKSRLQLIPYIVIVDSTNNYEESRVLSYSRGNKSGESRLVGMHSIGFGGHVDTLPQEGDTVIQHLAKEAARELAEELNFRPITNDYIYREIAKSKIIAPKPNDTLVNSVHLAIPIYVGYESLVKTMDGVEEGHIEDLKWVTYSDFSQQLMIQSMVHDDGLRYKYEDWSAIAGRRLLGM